MNRSSWRSRARSWPSRNSRCSRIAVKAAEPSFVSACEPGRANDLYLYFCRKLSQSGLVVEQGRFQAMMDVELVNWGPVTVVLDSRKADSCLA